MGKLRLTNISLKAEFKNVKTPNLHITHFNLENIRVNDYPNIEYVDNKGFIVTLKERGCVKPKNFKQAKRRTLKFEKL